MVEINLLPWREEKKLYQRHALTKTLMLTFLATLFLLISMHYFLSSEVNTLNKLLHSLQQERYLSKALPQPLPKIYQPPFTITLLFSTLNKMNEKVICLTDVEQRENSFLFAGNARSLEDLTDYLTHGQLAALFSQIIVDQLEEIQPHFIQFRFHAIQEM